MCVCVGKGGGGASVYVEGPKHLSIIKSRKTARMYRHEEGAELKEIEIIVIFSLWMFVDRFVANNEKDEEQK